MIFVKKVENSKKIEQLKFKKVLATAGLILSLGMVAIPAVPVHAEETLWEDNSSDDVNLTDAEENGVEQTNHPTETGNTTETVNDGSVDTSKDTNTKDAEKDEYNGNDDDYFDSWEPDDDYKPHIDSDDEVTIKHPPVPKTGDNPWVPVAGLGGVTASLLALYEMKKKILFASRIAEEEVVKTK